MNGRFAAALILLLVAACGNETTSPTEAPVVTQVNDGWNRFADGDYEGALQSFEKAIATDSNIGDGYNGIGWTRYAMARGEESPDLTVPLSYFDRAVAEGFEGAGAQAGRCLILNILSEYGQAVDAGKRVVAIDPAFVLEGDGSIEIRDIHLAMAQSYMGLGDYDKALEQALIIDPNRDPINPNSGNFVQVLISRLQDLQQELD